MAGFVDRFDHLFAGVLTRGVTEGDDFVASPSDEVILRSIRRRYLVDATVAILLVGQSTWTRRFVDWELAAATDPVVGQPLPVLTFDVDGHASRLPPRLGCTPTDPARVPVPNSAAALRSALDELEVVSSGDRSPAVSPRPLMRTDIATP